MMPRAEPTLPCAHSSITYTETDGLRCGHCGTALAYIEREKLDRMIVIRAGAVDLIERLAHARLEEIVQAIGTEGLDAVVALVREFA